MTPLETLQHLHELEVLSDQSLHWHQNVNLHLMQSSTYTDKQRLQRSQALASQQGYLDTRALDPRRVKKATEISISPLKSETTCSTPELFGPTYCRLTGKKYILHM